jgi:hypothetical protein
MPKPAPKPEDYMPPKSGALKRAEILSLLFKHGVGISKDAGCAKHKKKKKSKKAELLKRAKKVLVTASKKVPEKTKEQVAKALDKSMPNFKSNPKHKAKCAAIAKFARLRMVRYGVV